MNEQERLLDQTMTTTRFVYTLFMSKLCFISNSGHVFIFPQKKNVHTHTHMSILDSEILHFQNAKNSKRMTSNNIQQKKNYSNNKNSQNFHRHHHYHYEIYTSDNLWIITRAEPPLLPPQLPLLLLKKNRPDK